MDGIVDGIADGIADGITDRIADGIADSRELCAADPRASGRIVLFEHWKEMPAVGRYPSGAAGGLTSGSVEVTTARDCAHPNPRHMDRFGVNAHAECGCIACGV